MSTNEARTNPQETVFILHELDLGQHTLFLMSDGSLDLLANNEHTRYLTDQALSLDAEEAYRLFSALAAQWQARHGEE